MPDRIRLGILGCGAITQNAHLPAALRHPGVKVTALVDVDLNRARLLQRSIGSRLSKLAERFRTLWKCRRRHHRDAEPSARLDHNRRAEGRRACSLRKTSSSKCIRRTRLL